MKCRLHLPHLLHNSHFIFIFETEEADSSLILSPDQNSNPQLTLHFTDSAQFILYIKYHSTSSIIIGRRPPPLSGLGHRHLSAVKDHTCQAASPRPPSLHSHTWFHQWIRAPSPLKFLAVKQPQSRPMMIYFQLQAGFVNTVINEERPQSRIPPAGLLKWKHTAFQHQLA